MNQNQSTQTHTKQAALKGGSMLAIGNGSTQMLSFARNLIIGRMLSPSDFGVAGAFAIMLNLIEITSDLAMDKLLVQADDGDDERLQKAAHLLQCTRGVIGAILMVVLAPWVAELFGAPEARHAFAWLALVPLSRGLVHLDIKRYQRTLRFGPQVGAELTSHILITLSAAPAALYFGNYEAALWLVVAQSVFLTVLTHFLAERSYRWALDFRATSRIIAFGWPLLANGLLYFAILQGDKAIVGSFFGPEPLGVYTAAFMIAMTPAMLLARSSTSLLLPMLSRRRENHSQFSRIHRVSSIALAIVGITWGAALVTSGDRVLTLLFGNQYASGGAFIGWLGIMWGIRLLRVVPTIVAMSHGDTRTALISNIGRALAIPAAIWFAMENRPLEWIAAAGAAGEVVALVITGWRVSRIHRVGPGLIFRTASFALAIFSGAELVRTSVPRGELVNDLLILILTIAASSLIGLALFGELRREIFHLLGIGREIHSTHDR